MDYPELLGFLENERKQQKVSREKLEELSGVSASTITKWSHGINKPHLESMILCVEALGYEICLRRKNDGAKKRGQPGRKNNAV